METAYFLAALKSYLKWYRPVLCVLGNRVVTLIHISSAVTVNHEMLRPELSDTSKLWGESHLTRKVPEQRKICS